MYHLRAVMARPSPNIENNGMSEESEYSDDVDSLETDKETSQKHPFHKNTFNLRRTPLTFNL